MDILEKRQMFLETNQYLYLKPLMQEIFKKVEAIRAGFKNSWEQKDFKTIKTLVNKIPQNILLEDELLLMY